VLLVQLSQTIGDWSSAITPIAEAFQNGEVEWFTSAPGQYVPNDPTKTDAPVETEIGTTPARIQHLREPRDVNSAYQENEYRRIRVQIPSSDLDLAIVKGVKGRITNGGKDPNLVGVVLVVQDARNSSWAAIRTVEAMADSSAAPPEPPEEEEP
jgi:hypothetical protein